MVVASALTAALRPGVHVVRRDNEHVQVGMDPRHCVILPAEPDALMLLDRLGEARLAPTPAPPPSAAVATVLRRLVQADLLVDAEELAQHRGRLGTDADAAFALYGTDAPRRLEARRKARVRLTAVGRATGVDRLGALVRRSGVQVLDAQAQGTADLWVLVSDGPLPRATVDPLVNEGAPHLVLSGHGAGLRVGPLVEPATTACLRCVDAHESESDPRRQLITEQLAALPPAPTDPALLALAHAWAARDLLGYLEGDRPATWSATVTITGSQAPVVRSWYRHPHCGCAWDVLPY